MIPAIKNLFTIGAFILTTNAFGQDTLKLSVMEAQSYALEFNRSIQASKIDIEIAKRKVQEYTAMGLPQLSVSADYQHLFKVPEVAFPISGFTQDELIYSGEIEGFEQFPGPSGLNQYLYEGRGVPLGTKDNTTINLIVSQLIFSGDYLVALQASKIVKDISEKSSVKSELSIKESVASSYYLLLILDENLRVLKDNKALTDKTYHEIQNMYQQGFVEETDVLQIKINISTLENLISSFEKQKEVAIKLFKFQLGLDFEQNIRLTENIDALIEKGNFQYLVKEEFNPIENVDYKLVSNQVNLMAAGLKREKLKFLPTVSLFYRHQEMTNAPTFNFMPKDVVGLSANLPLFTSSQRISTLSQAKLNLQKSTLIRSDVEQGLMLEFEQAKNEYQLAFLNYSNNKESRILSEQIYNTTLIKYKEGVVSSTDLTLIQRQFLTAESNYLNSIISLLQAKAKLDRILTKS